MESDLMLCETCHKKMIITQKTKTFTEYYCEDCNSYLVFGE